MAHAEVAGLEHIPRTGGVLIVARHYHHLIDGALLITYVPRPVHIVVGLDWARDKRTRRIMETVCRLAQWPVVLRAETLEVTGTYARSEVLRYTRRALREVSALLRDGRVVVVFPEGYPNVDPGGSRKTADEWLPFAAGFVTMLRVAERAGAAVTVVPAGFAYTASGSKWNVRLRFGAPLATNGDDARLLADTEASVHALSRV